MSRYLTQAELHDLTDLEQPAAQARWLRERGWRFEVGASGRVKVDREYHRARMVEGGQAEQAPKKKRVAPDVEALDALQVRH